MKKTGNPGHRFGLLFGYTAKTDSQVCYLLEFTNVFCIRMVVKQVFRQPL